MGGEGKRRVEAVDEDLGNEEREHEEENKVRENVKKDAMREVEGNDQSSVMKDKKKMRR